MLRQKLAGGFTALALALAATGSVAYAGGNGNSQAGNNNNQGQGNGGPNVAATPELDSSVLFAFGTAALAGVSLLPTPTSS